MAAESTSARVDAPDAPVLDGRLQRSRRTRLAIVDALRALNAEGDLAPTVAQVAERAGIARRTVWQHFTDLETLFLEAGRRDYEVATSIGVVISADQPLEDRIERFTEQRARVFEAMTPSWRAGRVQEPFSQQIRRNKEQLLTASRKEVERLFRAELDTWPEPERRELSAALFVAAGWATWEALRAETHLSVEETRGVVVRTITALLSTGPPHGGRRR